MWFVSFVADGLKVYANTEASKTDNSLLTFSPSVAEGKRRLSFTVLMKYYASYIRSSLLCVQEASVVSHFSLQQRSDGEFSFLLLTSLGM